MTSHNGKTCCGGKSHHQEQTQANETGGCCGGKGHHGEASAEGTHVDPICKMSVDPATAKNSYEHDGTKYYFCCAGCLKKFVADPDQYVKQ